MPRTLLQAPGHNRDRSLGWLAVAWMEHFCRHGPGDVQGQPVKHGDEFTGFIVDCYALDEHGKLSYDSAFFSRPKGCDKSGLGSRFALFEALGPCRFLDWAKGGERYQDQWGLGFEYVYEPGEPMGRPVQTPYVRLMATEESQVGNVYKSVYFNLTDDECPLSLVPGVDAGLSRVLLPDGGEIMPSTASSASKDGGKETWTCFDEALDLDTPLPTPDGWVSMRDVEVGDLLIGADGQPVKVIKTTETMTDRDCYRVTFRDGSQVTASAGHLWQTKLSSSAAKPRIRTTQEMVSDGRPMMIPRARPWDLPERKLDIDPYVLGLWLGDGDKNNAVITASWDDAQPLIEQIEKVGYTVTRSRVTPDKAPVLYISVPGSHRNRWSPVRGLLVRLREAGLLGNKHIPSEYLRASIEQRLALIQGLMDADGHANNQGGACCFVNSNEALVDSMLELLRSFGENPVKTFVVDKRSRVGGYWKVTFTARNMVPFRMPRKADRVRVRTSAALDSWVGIRSIEKVDSVPVRCVGVDNEDHLFLAGTGGHVTHNTHLYNLPDLRRMYETVTRNLRKRKRIAGTWYLETTTMFASGEDSVAEATYGEAESLREGRKTRGRHRLLYDHRWGEIEDLTAEEQLRAAVMEAFGEAIEWNDIDGIIDEFYDTRSDPINSRRFFLNAQTSATDAWLTAVQWDACARPDRHLADKDFVTLSLDGAVNDDSTALVACRISDGHIELLGCWERPAGKLGDGWQVDRVAVDAAVAQAMERFEVAAFFLDPPHWQDYSDKWTAEFGEQMQVKATAARPLEWWTTRPRAMVAALERFFEALNDHAVSFTPAADRVGEESRLAITLRRHALNARRRPGRSGLTIAKEFPKSPKKIDALMAAVLAWEARADCRAAGVQPRAARSYPARRIR